MMDNTALRDEIFGPPFMHTDCAKSSSDVKLHVPSE